jgi:hypothetical protein
MDLTNTTILKLPLPSTIPTARLVPQEWQDSLEQKMYAARVWMREHGLRDEGSPRLPVCPVEELEEPVKLKVRRVA